MWKIILPLCLLLFSCGRSGEKPQSDTSSVTFKSQLQAKYDLYLKLLPTAQDQHGFILHEECDALLFTGLLGIIGNLNISIEAAKKPSGEWTRRPLVDGEDTCYPGNSKSSISRDMYVGLLWYIWKNQRLDLANEIWDYGQKNDWNMGSGAPSRTYFTPAMQGLLAEIIYRLGGKDHYIRSVPLFYGKNEGFQAHLDVLTIMLWGELRGEVSQDQYDILKHHNDRSPDNALFSFAYHRYTDGNYDRAIQSLLNEAWFPADRLPTSRDRKEFWIWQRDPGSDWEPKLDGHSHVHAGADLLFVVELLRQAGAL